jgi:hypothetical protein
MRIHFAKLLALTALLSLFGCSKKSSGEAEEIKGTWVREATNGSGPGNTLTFSMVNGRNILSFDCSGSPGPNWPTDANSEYRFVNGMLSYLNYADSSMGFYTTTSFKWIVPGKEFEIKFREILLFMSADYLVKYKKIP